MGELNEHDLDRLFRTAGHVRPASDLSDRIMARVAVTPLIRATEVKPPIGGWGWGAILCSVALLVCLLLGTAPAQDATDSPVSSMLRTALDGPSLPAWNWPMWMSGAAACLLLFAVLDRVLAVRSAVQRSQQ